MDDDELIVWQDVLDEIAAGRPDNLSCPHCNHTPMRVERTNNKTRISCPQCKRYVEGVFQF